MYLKKKQQTQQLLIYSDYENTTANQVWGISFRKLKKNSDELFARRITKKPDVPNWYANKLSYTANKLSYMEQRL